MAFWLTWKTLTNLAERLMEVLRLSEAEWLQMSKAALATAIRYTWDDATNLLESALYDVVRDARRTFSVE